MFTYGFRSVSTVAYSLTSCSKNNHSYVTESYYTLSSNPSTKHYFDKTNTPISAFCALTSSGYNNNEIAIDNSSVNINDICLLAFGSSYASEYSLGNGWMDGWA